MKIHFIPTATDSSPAHDDKLEFQPNEKCTRILHYANGPEKFTDSSSDSSFIYYEPKYLHFVQRTFFLSPNDGKGLLAAKSKSSRSIASQFTLHSLQVSQVLRQKRNNFDHLIGFLSSLYLYINSAPIIHQLKYSYNYFAYVKIKEYTTWLMGWPAGLKLNNQLDQFLGEMFLWLLDVFHSFLKPALLLPYFYFLGVALAFFIGLSPLLALISDLLAFFTFHFFLFSRISARLYAWQVKALFSLFHLFRGKKWNVLRSRLDSNEYDLDQLLLGTVLFTLLFFGFPTITVYYVLFGFCRVMISLGEFVLHIGLVALMALRRKGEEEEVKRERDSSGGLEIESFHFEKLSENELNLVVKERSAIGSYLKRAKSLLKIPSIKFANIIYGNVN